MESRHEGCAADRHGDHSDLVFDRGFPQRDWPYVGITVTVLAAAAEFEFVTGETAMS